MSNPRDILHKIVAKAANYYPNYTYNKGQIQVQKDMLELKIKRGIERFDELSLESSKYSIKHFTNQMELAKLMINKNLKYFNKTKRVMLEKGFDVSDIHFDLIDKTVFE